MARPVSTGATVNFLADGEQLFTGTYGLAEHESFAFTLVDPLKLRFETKTQEFESLGAVGAPEVRCFNKK